jgi:TetR/AcrR family transcriptional repressor of nem operon
MTRAARKPIAAAKPKRPSPRKAPAKIAIGKPQNRTRQKLVDAAHALIWANSYAHVSVEDICREAGVQKGSFYHFFPTKADLAAAALEDHWQMSCTNMEAIFTGHASARAQLRALCGEVYKKQETSLIATGKVCGCPYATVGAEMSGSNEKLRRLSEEMTERFCGYLERLLKNAATEKLIPTAGIKERAREMHIHAIGAMLQARITNRLDSVGKSLEHSLLRLSGMGAAKQTPASRKKP